MYSLDPFEGPLGELNANHLLRRSTFGPTLKNIRDTALLSATEAVDMLFESQDEPLPPVDPATGEDWVSPRPGENNSDENALLSYFGAWHIELMRTEPLNIREKIAWFYHIHLPVAVSKVQFSTPVYYQNKLFRYYAFGSFKTLFKKIVIDNAMLWYLDNTLNQAENPNENFAREMFELYTIGKGPQIDQGDYTNYTEDDIRAAARVLTGYLVDLEFEKYDEELQPETKIAQGYVYTNEDGLALIHDPGIKKFSDKFQNREIKPDEIISGFATEQATLGELDDLMDMIFEQEETARFLIRKVYRFFVYHKITEEVENEIIEPLAQIFRESDYNLSVVLKTLLKSKHFYHADSIETHDNHLGALVKSPIDLFVGILKFFQLELPEDPFKLYKELYGDAMLNYLNIMGMPFYNPEDVAGFPAYFQEPGYNRNWITPTNLAFRYLPVYIIILGIFNSENELLLQLDIVDWVDNPENITSPSDPRTLVQEITKGMFANPLPEERLDYFIGSVFMDGLPEYYWTNEWVKFKDTGDDTLVRALLFRLMVGLMQSPEFQLF